MAAKQMLYTESGYNALVEELEYLKNIKRQEVKDNLATARSYGDLSENSEYDEARNEQAKVEARISELEHIILHAKVINEAEMQADIISVGSVVKVYDLEFEEEVEYCIVGSNEADPLSGKISDQSPIGSAMIGAHTGDEITASTPGGEIRLRILHVSRANK